MQDNFCPVCFEVIGLTNNCITPCGHKLCLICMLKCIKQKNSCPCCRTILIEENDIDDNTEYEEESYEEESYEESLYETDATPEDYNTEDEPYQEPYEDPYLVSLDRIADELKIRGYTLLDILYFTFNENYRKSRIEISSTPSYTFKQFQDLVYGLDEELLNEELLRELNENKLMAENDNKPQIEVICDYVSLDKIADKLEKQGYTHLDLLHCFNCDMFNCRLKNSSLPTENIRSDFYICIEELDGEKYNENNETLMMNNEDIDIKTILYL